MVNRYAFADFLAGKKKASVPGIGYRHLCLDYEANTRRCVFFGNLLMFYLAELNLLVKKKNSHKIVFRGMRCLPG
jgi:hypothetical protein